MTRLSLLALALLLFSVTPRVLSRLRLTPRWAAGLAFVALLGLFLGVVSFLAAVLLPEVLVVSSVREIWTMCARAFQAIFAGPLDRIPSIAAGVALALLLGRFAWSILLGVRATRTARVQAGEPRWTLAGRRHVYVLPLDHPAAYSVGGFRGQVVLSAGLLRVLDEDERRAVLLHEEAHLRGRHHLVMLFARGVRAALAPLPPARWALGILETALEEAADDHAAARMASRPTVASSLSKAALAGLPGPVGALSLGGDVDVTARIRRLLSPVEIPYWAPLACIGLLTLLVGALAVTQVVAGLSVVAAAHHLVGLGTAVTCPLTR